MYEVEIKFEVDDKKITEITNGKNKVSESGQLDEYYDFEGLKLYKRHAFLRFRDHEKLNWKSYPSKNSIVATEIAFYFKSPDFNALNEIADLLGIKKFSGQADEKSIKEWLAMNMIKPLIVLDKKRSIFEDGTYLYSVDDVKGLGKYMEIERETQNRQETEQIKEELKKMALKMGVETIDEKGYVQLYVEKYHPELIKK